MKGIQSYTDGNWSEIPQKQGVYYFFLNNISFLKCGLYRNKSNTKESLIRARRQLALRMTKLIAIMRATKMVGSAQEANKAPYLGSEYSLEITELYSGDIETLINELSLESIPDFITFVEQTYIFNTPLYVGKTLRQTLQARYRQHRNDYHQQNDGTFGCRLRDIGIDWDDLKFVAYSLPNPISDHQSLISAFERYLHTTSKPILSER